MSPIPIRSITALANPFECSVTKFPFIYHSLQDRLTVSNSLNLDMEKLINTSKEDQYLFLQLIYTLSCQETII